MIAGKRSRIRFAALSKIAMSRTTVIIPSLNALTLPKALHALQQQTTVPDEIIVVGKDDANALTEFPTSTFIDTGEPVCAAAARNRGIQASTGNILLFLDADCIPASNWVELHLRHQANGHQVVGGGVVIDNENYLVLSDNVSMFHEFVAQLPSGTRQLLPTLNLSVHRDVIEAVGLMDESFPGASGEDSDWTIRIRLAGYTLHFMPDAQVTHAPTRTQFSDLLRHWRGQGRSGIRVRLRYADYYNTPALARNPLFFRLLSPLIALQITSKIYAQRNFWRYWRSLPLVYLSKIVYCFSAARALKDGSAFR